MIQLAHLKFPCSRIFSTRFVLGNSHFTQSFHIVIISYSFILIDSR